MSRQMEKEMKLNCKAAQQRFALMREQHRQNESEKSFPNYQRQAVESHLSSCRRCAQEYRLLSLAHTVLDLTASPEVIEPDNDFFVALRARIARGDTGLATARNHADDSWSAALWITARQMIPAMAMLLLLIISATLLWNQPLSGGNEKNAAARYEVSDPSPYDLIDSTVIAAEEKSNGR